MNKKVKVPHTTSNPFLIQANQIAQLREKIEEAKNGFDFNSLNDSQRRVILATLISGVERTHRLPYYSKAMDYLTGSHEDRVVNKIVDNYKPPSRFKQLVNLFIQKIRRKYHERYTRT